MNVPPFKEIESKVREKTSFHRRRIVEMVYRAKTGHPGGALGMADVYTLLHHYFMRDDPKKPKWENRDRFLLSNGHICALLYSILSDKGYFETEELWTFRKLGSRLQGHPSTAKGLPGVELSAGSLGVGLSVALGVALAARLCGKSYNVFCGISDGECQEGQPWEAAMAGAYYKVDNLCAIVDYNGTQIDGKVKEIMDVAPFGEKWRSFGWRVEEIDGHDLKQIYEAFSHFVNRQSRKSPTVIIAKTVIGKGVSFMEGDYHWHHGYPTDEQYQTAIKELSRAKN